MVVFVVIHALGEMVGVHRNLHHVQVVAVGIEHE